MNRKTLALKIGEHILDSIQKMQEDKKDFGRFVTVPFQLGPIISDEPPWFSSMQVDMPRFMKREWVNGEPKYTQITMAEYYGWKK